MKKYLISAASCQENNAVIVSANSIDDVIAMLRRGEVDLSGVIVRKMIKSIKLISTINCLEPPISLSENPLCGFELRY